MKDTERNEGVVLPVHRVSTELGEGDTEVHWTVQCPTSQHTEDLRACEVCPQFQCLQHDEAGAQSLSCTPRELAPPVSSPSEAFHALLPPLLEHSRVDALMCRDVHCVGEELSAEELARLFATHKVSGVPVVDEDARPVGVVSRTDLLRAPDEEEEVPVLHPERAGATVAELMNPTPVVVREDMSVPQAAAMMAASHVHRVLVVSAEGAVVGILTSADVVRWVARQAGYAV